MDDFDLMAEDYDTKERKERARTVADELRRHISDGAAKSAIEFGCGTGLVGFELIEDFGSVIFLDSSAAMIKQVEQKLHNMGIEKSSAVCCDLTKTMPKHLSADYIFSVLALHHIIDTEAILTRLFDLLNKDGRLLIIDLDKDDGSFHAEYEHYDGHNGFEQPWLSGLAKKAGFKKVETRTFYHASKLLDGDEKPYSFFVMDAVK